MTDQTPASERPAIAAAIIVHERRVLLVKRKVKEGTLSWQFPAGQVEPGEAPGEAAVREAREETGLTVAESKTIGERVHPNTGRTMIYIACDLIDGQATVADDDELDEFAWSARQNLDDYVPHGFFGPVQEHLDIALADS